MDNQTLQLLKQTAQHFSDQQQQAYLVGGSLRNILLGEACVDWDIVTTGDAHKLARRLADRLGGYYARLHEKASRVVVVEKNSSNENENKNKKEITFDVSPLNEKTLEDDLRQRDFTINAMAAPLGEVARHLEAGDGLHLIDPLHGMVDLEARRLKAVDGEVFRHDPLRMLRAVRLMMRYDLNIDAWTEGLMMRDAELLPQVAAERVHDELYAILGPGGATGRLRFLDEHGLFTVIFPEFVAARGMRQPGPHYWDVLEHSLESVGALERVSRMVQEDTEGAGTGDSQGSTGGPEEYPMQGGASTPAPTRVGGADVERWATTDMGQGDIAEIRVLLREAGEQGIFSFAGLTAARVKMAALLHDIGKTVTYSCDEEGGIHFYNHPQAGVPLVEQVMRRLCASTQDRRLAQLVAAHHMRPGQLGQNGPVTPRAIRRYFVDLGPTGIYVALFSLADHLATLGPQPLTGAWERHLGVVRLLLTRYVRERESILPPRLISPEELMRRLKLEPGPVVGQLLELIAEAQAEGTVHSKEEAILLARETLSREYE